jgi:hypothetical protein
LPSLSFPSFGTIEKYLQQKQGPDCPGAYKMPTHRAHPIAGIFTFSAHHAIFGQQDGPPTGRPTMPFSGQQDGPPCHFRANRTAHHAISGPTGRPTMPFPCRQVAHGPAEEGCPHGSWCNVADKKGGRGRF